MIVDKETIRVYVIAYSAAIIYGATSILLVLELAPLTNDPLLFAWAIGGATGLLAKSFGRALNRVDEWRRDRATVAREREVLERGQVQLPDVVMTFFLLIAYVVIYPFLSHFTDLVVAEADPFSSLLLRLAIAIIPLLLIISVGVSARRGGY